MSYIYSYFPSTPAAIWVAIWLVWFSPFCLYLSVYRSSETAPCFPVDYQVWKVSLHGLCHYTIRHSRLTDVMQLIVGIISIGNVVPPMQIYMVIFNRLGLAGHCARYPKEVTTWHISLETIIRKYSSWKTCYQLHWHLTKRHWTDNNKVTQCYVGQEDLDRICFHTYGSIGKSAKLTN